MNCILRFFKNYQRERRLKKRLEEKTIKDEYKRTRKRQKYLWNVVRKRIRTYRFINGIEDDRGQNQMTGTYSRGRSMLNSSDYYQNKKCNCFISERNSLYVKFQVLVWIATLISFISIPMNIGLNFLPHNSIYQIDILIDIIIIADIPLNFVIIRNEDHKTLHFVFPLHIIRYLKSFFLFDTISILSTLCFGGNMS